MRLIFQLIFIFFLSVALHAEDSEKKKFVLIFSSERHPREQRFLLESIFNQTDSNYRLIYVLDQVTEDANSFLQDLAHQYEKQHLLTIIQNPEPCGPLANLSRVVNTCEPDEIIIPLKENQLLIEKEAINRLNQVYHDPHVWSTYCEYKEFTSDCFPTFYAGLFHRINKKDLLNQREFISIPSDLIFATPILQMAEHHTHAISPFFILLNPIEETRTCNLEHLESLNTRTAYPPIESDLFLKGKELPSIYQQIEDIMHPTIHDYRFLQNHLTYGNRPQLERLADMYYRAKMIKLIGSSPQELPKSGQIPINCDPLDRENCLLLYATFNDQYPRGLERLLNLVVKSDFKGHLLYQLGGWPDLEGGSLVLSHVPYAFKAAFFKEAQRLGFKKVLWLDVSVVPLVNLNTIFEKIKKEGYFVMGNSHTLGKFMNPYTAAYFGLTHKQTYQIPSCSSGLFGIDLTKPVGTNLIDLWYKAAFDEDAYFSARSDQTVLSILLYQHHITDFESLEKMPHSFYEIKEDSLFWLDREYVH